MKNVVSWHVAALFRRLKEEAGEEAARKSERGARRLGLPWLPYRDDVATRMKGNVRRALCTVGSLKFL